MSVQSDDPMMTNAGGQPDGASSHSAGGDLDTLRAELAEIEQKADEYLRLAQRTQADFVNYRRRVEEERAQQTRDANNAFLQRLFPVLDDLDRALGSASETDRQSSWFQGVQLVERNLRGLLASDGVELIDAQPGGEFDPRFHEAVGSLPTQDQPEGRILHVARQGYRKADRVLRPTQVVVAARS